MRTGIEYVDATWNPIVGCLKVNPGCRNCYAERQAGRVVTCLERRIDTSPRAADTWNGYASVVRWRQNSAGAVVPDGWNGRTTLIESALNVPFEREKPTTYLVCSMGDLFCEVTSLYEIDRVIDTALMRPQHTFLILTKRPRRAVKYARFWEAHTGQWPFADNIILGTTVTNQRDAINHIPYLRQLRPNRVFVSLEPLLDPVHLYDHREYPERSRQNGPAQYLLDVDQVIVGGESGPGARPMDPDWVRSIRDQCHAAEIPFFLKQWGDWIPEDQMTNPDYTGPTYDAGLRFTCAALRVGKKRAGRTLDGRTHDELIWRENRDQER